MGSGGLRSGGLAPVSRPGWLGRSLGERGWAWTVAPAPGWGWRSLASSYLRVACMERSRSGEAKGGLHGEEEDVPWAPGAEVPPPRLGLFPPGPNAETLGPPRPIPLGELRPCLALFRLRQPLGRRDASLGGSSPGDRRARGRPGPAPAAPSARNARVRLRAPRGWVGTRRDWGAADRGGHQGSLRSFGGDTPPSRSQPPAFSPPACSPARPRAKHTRPRGSAPEPERRPERSRSAATAAAP